MTLIMAYKRLETEASLAAKRREEATKANDEKEAKYWDGQVHAYVLAIRLMEVVLWRL